MIASDCSRDEYTLAVMTVIVQRNAPGAPRLDASRVRTIAGKMLAELELPEAELSILLTNDAQIRELNREHRDIDRPTDVLAFPQVDSEQVNPESVKHLDGELLGDVVISLDTARAQADRRGVSLLDEVVFLLAHGLLHLVGFDHASSAQEAEMTQKTLSLVDSALPPKGR